MRAQVYLRAGAIAHVAATELRDDARAFEPRLAEFDAAGAPVELELRVIDLDEPAGGPAAVPVDARELLEALELGADRRPRFRADAPGRLRALRLVEKLPEPPPVPADPPPMLELAGGAASIDGGYLEQTPPGWRDRLAAWWKGTA